jgi:hypothetical protein
MQCAHLYVSVHMDLDLHTSAAKEKHIEKPSNSQLIVCVQYQHNDVSAFSTENLSFRFIFTCEFTIPI